MNSPYLVHPALHSQATERPIPFPGAKATRPPGKLEVLVALEAEIRKLPDAAALTFHAINEAAAMFGFDDAFMFRLNRRNKPVLQMSSGVARIENTAALTQALNRHAAAKSGEQRHHVENFELARGPELKALANGIWAPLQDRAGKTFGWLLYARAEPFDDAELLISKRLAETYAHAFVALTPPNLLRTISLPRWSWLVLPFIMLALAFIRVPLTALAPFEVVADRPAVITAPLDGAIAEVLAEPNKPIKEGDELFRLEDTAMVAEAKIATERASVAQAKLATAKNAAFSNLDLKRQLTELEADAKLAIAEQNFAQSQLARAVVVAPRDGLLIYASKNDLVGKPVRVGEKIMEIADAGNTAFKLELSIHDAISIDGQNRVKLFLDSDPLNPLQGKVTEMSYHAVERPGGALAYILKVAPEKTSKPQRIGLRGTAQIHGDDVRLGFYLFRRPIAALRQYWGY